MAGIITVLKEDHQKVEAVFKKLEAAQPGEVTALLRQVAELLIPHAKAEEQIVYPAIKAASPGEQSDVADAVGEHHHVEKTLRELLALDPEAPGADGLIAAMIGEVRHHVEEEEQEILPAFAKDATNTQLGELATEFTAAKQRILNEKPSGI